MRCFAVVLAGLLTLFGSGAALAYGRCTDAGYLAGFDPRLGRASCRVIHNTEIRWDGRSAPLRVIVAATETPTLDEHQAEFIARVDELVGRVGAAMSAFGDVALNETSVLLTDLERGGYHAGTFDGTGGDECKIAFYKTDLDISLDKFLFTLAHELFHCVQYRTWPALYAGDEALWWYEGSAEYFAHAANPNSSEGDQFINDFDAESVDSALYAMNYPAVVFFLWLGGERGAEGVATFVRGMATEEGAEAQIAALRARVPIDMWTEFGRDYLDSRIRQPGGRTIPSLVDQGESISISGPGSFESSSSQYVLARQTIAFDEGRTYVLRVEGASGEMQSRFSAAAGSWTDPPERVLACEDDKYFRVLNTAVEGDYVRQQVVVTDSEEVDERACCLIGEWTPTEESRQDVSRLQNQIGGEMAAAQGVQAPQCALLGGGWTLSFDPSGTGAISWEDFTNECKISLPRGDMRTRSVMSGVLAFSWAILDRNVGRARYTENTVATAVTTYFGPQSTRPHVGPLAGPSQVNFTYQCSPTDLSVSGLYNLGPGSAHTKRE